MVETVKVLKNINTNADIDQAAKQLADNVTIYVFNSSSAVAYSSNKIKPPPWVGNRRGERGQGWCKASTKVSQRHKV